MYVTVSVCTGVSIAFHKQNLPNVDAGNISVKLLCSKYTVNVDRPFYLYIYVIFFVFPHYFAFSCNSPDHNSKSSVMLYTDVYFYSDST